jgi:hypothetical protein
MHDFYWAVRFQVDFPCYEETSWVARKHQRRTWVPFVLEQHDYMWKIPFLSREESSSIKGEDPRPFS